MATLRSSTKLRIFRSLLLLSLLEGILWSLCLFQGGAPCGLAYYQRETVNLKSTTGRYPPPPVLLSLDTRALLLALRDEARARQRTLETSAELPATRDQIAQLASLRAFLPPLGQYPAETASDAAPRPGASASVAAPRARARAL